MHRATLAYGTAYVTVTPGVDDLGQALPHIRGVSPRRMYAVYDDDADDWPVYALRVEPSQVGSDRRLLLRLYDDQAVYFLSVDSSGDKPEYIETRAHDVGLCPVVRFLDVPDLEGRPNRSPYRHRRRCQRARPSGSSPGHAPDQF